VRKIVSSSSQEVIKEDEEEENQDPNASKGTGRGHGKFQPRYNDDGSEDLGFRKMEFFKN
jgi:hypothetical protein